jgi:hypothetical protein
VPWTDYVNVVGIAGALGFSAVQTRRLVLDARKRDDDRRTERALEFYRDLVVDGDTANAFNNLSTLLRNEGTRRFDANTWYVISDDELRNGGLLDPSKPGLDTTFQQFYRVLWYFERVEIALEKNLLDSDVLFRAIGFHCWWWGQLLRDVHAPKAVDALHVLAPRAVAWARAHDDYDRWVSRCRHDFNGGGPVEPGAQVATPPDAG